MSSPSGTFGSPEPWSHTPVRSALAPESRPHWELLAREDVGPAWWAEWDQLAVSYLESHPGLAAVFIALLVKYFADPRIVFATLHYQGAAIVKTLLQPLAGGRWTLFCPPQVTIAPLVFSRAVASSRPLLRDLLAGLGVGAWKLDLPYQDRRVSLLTDNHADRALLTGGWQSVSICAPDGYAAYWDSRTRDLRHNIERRERKAERDGLHLRLAVVSDPLAMSAAIDRFCDLESRGWKGAEGSALRHDNDEGRFYRELLTEMSRRQAGRVYELYAGDRYVAGRLVVSGGHRHIVLKTTYDESLAAYSPGFVLLHRMLREVLADPRNTVELYTHASPQQLEWATAVPQMSNLSVYRSGLIRRLFELRARLREA